jgi:predicted MPP superfamily phosphohydrolase
MQQSPERKKTCYLAFFILLIFISMLPAYMAWEAETPDVTVISVPGAPEGIVYIADPHIRHENIDTVRKVIDRINTMEPALVLIGGDFTSPGEEDLSLQAVWAEIDAPVYAVLGNHDYRVGIKGSGVSGRITWLMESILRSRGYCGSSFYSDPDLASPDILAGELEKNGVTVLRNEWTELEIDSQRVIICGVDDIWAGRGNPPMIPDNGSYGIYLVHEPMYREEWNADLILAGHTHGGQFNNGVFQLLDYSGVVDIRGTSIKNDTIMYVTRGIGTSKTGKDYRLFSSPEIVLINPPGDIQKG